MSRHRVAGALALGGALTLAACADDGGGSSDVVVDLFGSYRGREADLLVESLRAVPELDGIEIRYTGSRDFVPDLESRVRDDADPPDIAIVPQPGVIAELLAEGALAPLAAPTLAALDANYGDAARGLGVIDDVQVGVPYRLTVKSLVWYRPAVFAANGWSVPTTWAELEQLVADVAATGEMAPWCFAIQSGAATGWPATDWVEDVLLRQAGSETYDGWVAGDVDFADPVVADAFATVRGLVIADGRTAGDSETMLQTPVDEVASVFVADPPRCAMYKQADLALDWFPEGTEIGPDGEVHWFALPSVDGGPPPVLVGGQIAVAFDDRPEVERVMTALASPEGSEVWRESGTFVSPQRTVEPVDPLIAGLTQLAATAEVIRFDGSDSMPASVGTTTFWDAISRWVGGSLEYPALAEQLDAAFDRAG